MHSFKQKYLVNFWDTLKAMIALAIIASIYFGFFGTGWQVTGEMTRWGGEFLELFGLDTSQYSYYNMTNLSGNPLTRYEGLVLIGMFLGALIAAFLANKVKFRLPASGIRITQAIIGGLLSGFGARLAFGCNLLDFFTGLPYFSLHTWEFAIFMVLGIFVATKVGKLKIFMPKTTLEKCGVKGKGITHDKNRANRHFKYGLVLFIITLMWLIYLFSTTEPFALKVKSSFLPLGLIFGLIFGFVISRAQVCFTSCFRDLFLFGRDNAAKGAYYGMIIATFIVFILMLNDYSAFVRNISLAVAIGAFLFGFGIVFAGGCECGWTYRAAEGQVHFMIVGVANFAGTAILALVYDKIPAWIKEGPKIQLINELGALPALALNVGFLLLSLALIFAYKRHFFAKRRA
ncbi:selenium metabolism membrane protein YedE/FdhT [Campylobacter vulpis]|uniref:Selenium metabolism membrane protein YedE/FdhT n=1 Tax=Campylobacter vulpis TaxID=1655500 RepID=A0ABS5P339_9BACT|nr:selenium metabolism membrane protein YedE/FdhT [Campylobacter vulpis]MBS4240696.1 selenium metabolism membrane protein YedE/FdhT [Campylobacter vulpis]MBS4252020.1 selenium metabolism membrane protein YedE/FdhT [Campylobacter vulpis]MBS4275971.1 selenium metabolism membrane protein YedE/FdhT [Campylobacter vulpis]MBS4281310.1 selenium metabolism membrane protein YedE/FdhT [Campylobacter vulpis]MBS4306088.1 selenium metabolism membrane protein YedE/FdhT [Campylobacter vulpis]